jgi:hypothetical protein
MEISEMENIQGSSFWCHAILSATVCLAGAAATVVTYGAAAELGGTACAAAIAACEAS